MQDLQRIEELVREAWPVIFNREPVVSMDSFDIPGTDDNAGPTPALLVDGIFIYPTKTAWHTVAGERQRDAWGLGETVIVPLPPGEDFVEITHFMREGDVGADIKLVRELAARVAERAWMWSRR